MVHLCSVWSPKHPTHSDSCGLVWEHETATSLYISLPGFLLTKICCSHFFFYQTCLNECVGNGINHSPPPFSSVEFLLPQCYSLKSPLLSCVWFCHFAKKKGRTKVKKKTKTSDYKKGIVELRFKPLVSFPLWQLNQEQKLFELFFLTGFAFGSYFFPFLFLSLCRMNVG